MPHLSPRAFADWLDQLFLLTLVKDLTVLLHAPSDSQKLDFHSGLISASALGC